MAEEKEAKRQSLFDSDEEEGAAAAAPGASSETKSASNKIKINKKFAQDFETRKQKEELRRVRFEGGGEDDDEVGGDDNDNDDSSSSSEDEDAELLTTKLDVDILKTINALRRKDARIYDPNARFFQEATAEDDDGDDEQPQQNEKKKAKPKRYKDVVREQVLEDMEKDPDGADDEDDADAATEPASWEKTPRLAYDAQQQEYRKAFLESTGDHDGSEEDGDDSDEVIVKRRKKGDDDADDDEDADDDVMLQQQLLGEIERMKATASKDDKLVDPRGEVEDGEAFLLDYFKNRPWVEKVDDDKDSEQDDASNDNYDDNHKLPSTGFRSKAAAVDDDHSDEVSLQELEEADDFEAQYNFRFEQAAAATATGAEQSLQSYARGQTMNTLRRKDESRAEKRRARKERKAMERKAKEEQLKRLKNAKRQEMEDKLRKVKAVLGEVEGRGATVDETALMKLLEGDFDPEKFEELMKETYNDEFYRREDSEWKDDLAVRESLLKNDEDGKLLAGIDDLDGGLYDNQEEDEELEGGAGGEEEEEWPDDMEEEVVDEEYPPEESALEQKLKAKVEDELYKLDYEDIVAGMPTRFKYRQVEPNNYGLSTEEILFARDSTLKQFVSLKKMAPYAEQEHFVGSRQRRRFREMLKQDLQEEFGTEAGDETAEKPDDVAISEERKKKKRRRLKKGSKRERDVVETQSEENTGQLSNVHADAATKPLLKAKRKRRKKKSGEPVVDSSNGDADGDVPTDVFSEPVAPSTAGDDDNKKNKDRAHKKREKKKHKKKTKKKRTIEGVTESRLASYGL